MKDLKNMPTDIAFTDYGDYVLVTQAAGPVLGYSPASGARIVIQEGKAFKVFGNRDNVLPYEDWRLTPAERARDLASRLSIEEIAGLMLYSAQNRLPMKDDTYGGVPYAESGAKAWDLSDSQIKFLKEDYVRHVLVSTVESPEAAARWNNKVQAMAEGIGHGIPANNSSDPRHSAFYDAEFSPGAGGNLSLWSHLTGLACMFDADEVRKFADIASAEYRAMGLATALSPQIDLGTDPRWYRYASTFGNDPQLVADYARAYCDGFQTDESCGGWGPGSVNAMAKHWPGGGSGEGGRDAHYGNGKFAVYPGNAFEQHLIPFLDGAFALTGGTSKASAIMPYYTISYGISPETVGNSYSHYIVTDLLREKYGYDGVICTDWVITDDPVDPGVHWSKPYGVEHLTVAERHYKALMAGVDQFGGNNVMAPVIEAYEIGCREHGEEWMRRRMEQSAERLLMNIFRPGLFENPYVSVDHAREFVGSPANMAAGFEQQLKSVVMLKNHDSLLPLAPATKVYVARRRVPEMRNFWGGTDPALDYMPLDPALVAKHFVLVDSPEEADVAIMFMESPKSYRMGYDPADKEAGHNGYIPISLQYRPYRAVEAREHSLAADPGMDRSYRNKEARTMNECELDALVDLRKRMGDKPVVTVVNLTNPMVMSEIEPLSDVILTGFSVQNQAYLYHITGMAEPSGLLPFEMPASMAAIERHCEDLPHDIEPYVDADGNTYKFGYGLNFAGTIHDERTEKYVK